LKYAGLISLITFFGTILLMGVLILMIPTDYFSNPKRRKSFLITKRPLLGVILLIVKNLIGLIFLIVGFLLLFIPGQGILTIMIGIILMNFPGKYRLERKLVQRPGVLQGINKIRKKFNRPLLGFE
jgi:archaellum biogenesis protein FlaJ (TadC family)